ncbi:MAG: ABC transporter permease, partial [Verrucomicrobiota bacterium]
MILIHQIQLGIKSLLLHKLRSGLTMLGMIFGVCSVISMLAIGEGASYEAQERIKRLGSSNVIINSIKPPEDQDASAASSRQSYVVEYGLTYEDAIRLKETIPAVQQVVPIRIIRENIRFGTREQSGQVIGTLPNYPLVQNLDLIKGRLLTTTDQRNQKNVCVISTSLARFLFPIQDPLGNTIRMKDTYYQVVGLVQEVGTLAQRPQRSGSDADPIDRNVYIPLSTASSRFGETLINASTGNFSAERVELHRIIVKMRETAAVLTAEPQIHHLLQEFHEKADFELIVPLQLLREAEATKRMFNIVLGSIAAISLLVGGIGIMNIML